jgi:hypothetical protein
MIMVRLSAPLNDHLYLQDIFLALITVKTLSAVGRIKSLKNSNDTIGNRHKLGVFSAVPEPTAPPRDPTALQDFPYN